MKKLKKVLYMLIVTVMAMSLILAGCGKTSDTAQQESSKAAETSTQAATVEEKPVELTPATLSWYVVGTPQADTELVMKEFNKKLGEKLKNTSLDFQIIGWGDYEKKMQVKMGAGDEFDLCFTSSWMNKYSPNVAKGAYVELDELLPKYAPEFWKLIPSKVWDGVRIKGKIYGVVNYQVLFDNPGLDVRSDLLDKYKFDMSTVKKLSDLDPFLKQIRDNEMKENPGNFHAFDLPIDIQWATYGINSLNDIAGTKQEDASLNVFNIYASEEFKDFCFTMRDFMKKGYLNKDPLGPSKSNPGGTAVMFAGNVKPGGEIERSEREAKLPFKAFSLVPKRYLMSDFTSTLTAVSRTSKNPERAVMLLNLINTDKELYNMLSFGLEGTHYTKAEPDVIEIVKDSKYNPGTAWMFGNQFNAYYMKGQPKGIWEETMKLNEESEPSPIAGFIFDGEPIKTELANIKTVKDQYLKALICGAIDPDKAIPTFLSKLESAGAQKVLDETKKQLDAFMSSKK